MDCGILVPWPETGPESLEWESWVQDPSMPENSWSQGVLISEHSHEGLHLIQGLASPNCWQHPVQGASRKQQARRNKPSHQQTHFSQTPEIPPHTALSTRGENAPPPIRTQAQVPPNTKPKKTTGPNQPNESRAKRKREYYPKAWGKETSNTVR